MKFIKILILISNDLAMKLNKKFKNFEDKIIILNNTENDLVTNNIPQISKFESVENINKIIFNLLNKISYKERYIRNIISQELNYLGYSPKYYGTKYLCESIYIIYKNEEELSDNLEKIIYPIVAKKYRKTIQNIKCNIINATDIMICECEEQKLMKYLGYYNYVKPGPKKIIEAVLSKIKEKIQ